MRSWIPFVAMIVSSCVVFAGLWWAFHHAAPHRSAVNTNTEATVYREVLTENELRAQYHLARDNGAMKHGENLFIKYCTLCHGVHGQGLIGPNLRDDYWLNGSDLTTISQSIANGNPAQGMAAWKPVLSDHDLHALAFYVAHLSDTTDKNGKAAQGKLQPITWRMK
jgi:cbb3-type cytochrome c oxidase subunit III